MKIQNQNRSNLDLPQILHHRVQQVHPRPQALQLAIPDLTHHDPHVLLFLPHLPSRQSFQGHGTPIHHDLWPLPQICGTHWSSVLPFPLVLKLHLHLPLCLVHPNAQGSYAGCGLLHRGFEYRERWKQRGSLEYRVQIYEFWIQGGEIRSFEYRVQILIFTKLSLFYLVSLSFLCYFLFWHLNKIWNLK